MPGEPQRVLMIRPSALGDVCRTVPALVSLKRAWPGARIDWLVQDTFADAVRAHPDLGEVIPFPRHSMSAAMKKGSLAAPARFLLTLRDREYDLVLDLQGLARSGLFAWATRAGRRLGEASAREMAWLAYTERVETDPGAHTVDRMLAVVEAAGAEAVRDMRLYAPPEAGQWVIEQSWSGGRIVVIAPTSRWPGKQWPAVRFCELTRRLLADHDAHVVLVGAQSEHEQVPELIALGRHEERVTDLIGKTSIGQLMALISRAELVVANDSAPLHMAVGFERPLVALFGPTDTARVGPYGRDADVIQHVREGDALDHKDEASGRGLMGRITVEEVVGACGRPLIAVTPQPENTAR